jgi:nucleotide-binding universal stress UspA family protein
MGIAHRHLVVGAQGTTGARDALALGVRLAQELDASLTLVAVSIDPTGPGPIPHAERRREEAQAHLAALAADVPAELRAATQVVRANSVVQGLHRVAEHEQASMLVLGPTHVGKAGRAVHGDNTLGVLRTAPCAVAIAPATFTERRDWRAGRVGVAYVPTAEGRLAVAEAARLAETMGATLEVIAVMDLPPDVALDEEAADEMLDALGRRAQEAVGEVVEQAGARVPVEGRCLQGDPAEALLAASSTVDLMVMGSRGQGPLGRLVLGSVSARVVHRMACPLVIVPHGVREPA